MVLHPHSGLNGSGCAHLLRAPGKAEESRLRSRGWSSCKHPAPKGCPARQGRCGVGIFRHSFCSRCLLLAVSHCEWQCSALTEGHQEFNRATTQLLGGAAGDPLPALPQSLPVPMPLPQSRAAASFPCQSSRQGMGLALGASGALLCWYLARCCFEAEPQPGTKALCLPGCF